MVCLVDKRKKIDLKNYLHITYMDDILQFYKVKHINEINLFKETKYIEEKILYPTNNVCYLCKEQYSSRTKLYTHYNGTKHKPDHIKCKICDEVFCNKAYMLLHLCRDHLIKNKKGKDGKHRCYICKKEFLDIRKHINRHYGNKQDLKICLVKSCNKTARFNYIDTNPALYCFTHKLSNMIDIYKRKCKIKGCITAPTYNFQNKTKGLYCSKHRLPNMIDVLNKKCKSIGCNTVPIFNYKGEQKGLYCSKHKLTDMIDVVNNKCKSKGCNTAPNFNYEGKNKGLYCTKHKLTGMINICNDCCVYNNCLTRATYNYKGNHKPLYCGKHKKTNMINVKSKTCLVYSCYKQPTYNYKGIKEAIYCLSHKKQSMVNVKSKSCISEGCTHQPSYNFKNCKPKYCSKHKKSNMIDVCCKRCIINDCLFRAYHNYKGNKIPKYCTKHKSIGMVNVVSNCCEVTDCLIRAYYGYPSFGKRFCFTHRKEGTIKNPNKKCLVKNCEDYAIYGVSEQKRCELHKNQNDHNLLERNCVSCGLPELLDNNLCRNCNPTHFKAVRFAKQNTVKLFFDANNIKYTSYDKLLDNGICGKERPDFVIDAITHYIIIEVDENQHNSSTYKSCDIPRMINVSQSLGMKTFFIRYNPDNYKYNNNTIKPNDKKRLNVLKEWINFILNFNVTKLQKYSYLSVVHLFYNDYENTDCKLEPIDIYKFSK